MAKKKREHLPHELITEVLLRLPVKSVLRCKCVCKSWLSLISHPHFGTLHFQLAASPTHKLLFMEYYPRQTLSIDFHKWLDDDSASSLSPDFLHPESYPEIGGSCRGFLFLNCYGDFYLWNPSTGVHKEIPASPIIITALASISASNYKALELFYGFGYDMSSDDYMVVLGSYKHTYNSPPGSCSIDLEIYSLRANEWEQIEFDSDLPYRKTVSSQIGSFLNGSIHWLVYNYETGMDIIIAFDLKETTLSEIALPNDFYADDFSPKIYDLLVFGGLISVWTVEMSTLKIWVMQEYDVHSSWTKTFDFSFHPAPDFSPVCFTNGGDIVGPVADGGLVKLDDEGDLLEYHSYGNIHFARSQMAVYTESLLSLPGGTEQA